LARQPRARKILWANARRLAEGVELLHSQGVIHRNIDPWAVVTAFADEPDFRITGFEWSMRVATVAGCQRRKVQTPRVETSFSFARDWRDLALLIALFLDISTGPLGDMKIAPFRVADHASSASRKSNAWMASKYVCERKKRWLPGRPAIQNGLQLD
jgi:hypothetical protein